MTRKLIDRVRLARQGSAVERCHTTPHTQRYSVGHHSLDLITLITLTWQADHNGALPRAELLVAAAFHDVPEVVVGDIPSPAKRLIPGTSLQDAEDVVLAHLGVDVGLTPEEDTWLHLCDKLELTLWCEEESRLRGNKAFDTWGRWLLGEKEVPSSIGRRYRDRGFVAQQLTWAELKEAAAL